MLALTVMQPWASLLVVTPKDRPDGPGIKDVENRTWAAPHALWPSRWLAIHAGGQVDFKALRSDRVIQLVRERWPDGPRDLRELPRHTILGAVRIEGYGRAPEATDKPNCPYCSCRCAGDEDNTCDLRPSCSPWASGPVCWCFDRAVALPKPMTGWKGYQKLWTLNNLVAAHLQRAIDAAMDPDRVLVARG